MPTVSPARTVSGGSRANETGGVPRLDVLGQARPGVRRSGRPAPRRRACTRRPWRESDRPGLHRRPQRGVALPRIAPRGIREPTRLDREGRRTRAVGLLHRRGGAMRPPGEQADSGGVCPLPTLPGAGGRAPQEPTGRRRARCRRDGLLLARLVRRRPRDSISETQVPTRRPGVAAAHHVDRVLPSEPAKHADRTSEATGVRFDFPGRA